MPGASGARSPASQPKNAPMNAFERYLTLWVFICIVVGTGAGHYFPEVFQSIGRLELARVNIPVGVLIWVMIIPMLVRVDFSALGEVRRHARGIGVTLFINWLVKPFSMALLAWIFVRHVFAPWLPADQIDSYVAGLILLAAAPCTAMCSSGADCRTATRCSRCRRWRSMTPSWSSPSRPSWASSWGSQRSRFPGIR